MVLSIIEAFGFSSRAALSLITSTTEAKAMENDFSGLAPAPSAAAAKDFTAFINWWLVFS